MRPTSTRSAALPTKPGPDHLDMPPPTAGAMPRRPGAKRHSLGRALRWLACLAWLAAGPALASDALARQAGCTACHAADKKVLGPSWREIAARYKGRADAPVLLASHVRQGSKGVWGPLPMAPTDASKLSDADLKQLVNWLLKTPG